MEIIPFFFSSTVFYVCADLFTNTEYDFNVYPVDNCPPSKEDWDKRSNQLRCKSTHGYHCVPNVNLTSLIEFCYTRDSVVTVEAGYCLVLAGRGFLNQVSCESFSSGCPSGGYFSSQDLYKYPKCLAINTELGCFDADVKCVLERTLEKQTSAQSIGTTERFPAENRNVNRLQNDSTLLIIIGVLVVIVALLTSGIVILYCFWQKHRIDNTQQDTSTRTHLVQNQETELDQLHQDETSKHSKDCKDKKIGVAIRFPVKDDNDQDRRDTYDRLLENNDNELSVEEAPLLNDKDKSELDTDLQKLHDALVRNDEQEFNHLIGNTDRLSLNVFNKGGFNSLHLSARVGNWKFFRRILDSKVDINTTAVDGRNCLHIAAFHGSHPICNFILKKHKHMLFQKDRYNMNPAHWAALGGQESILKLFTGCDSQVVSEKTQKYDENIVLFACMGQSVTVCEFVKNCEDKQISDLLRAKNSEGWNAIQYAAKSGSEEVFQFLVENGLDIRNVSRQTKRNCLHTACEKGRKRICEIILKEAPDLIDKKDKYEQHVGHYAAKSGDRDILQLLIQQIQKSDIIEKRFLAKATTHNINILHIACRHARYGMCEAIVEQFPDLDNEITEKGWNAALFITEKAGAEKERIRILRFLEKKNLNVYHVARSGKTILYNACVIRSAELVQYLLKHYPDLLNIEKSMNPSEAAKSDEIEDIFRNHFENARKNITLQ